MIIQFHKPNVANGQGPREFLANPAQALSKALLKFGNDLSSMSFMLLEDEEKILRNTYTEQAMNKTKQSKLLKNVSGSDQESSPLALAAKLIALLEGKSLKHLETTAKVERDFTDLEIELIKIIFTSKSGYGRSSEVALFDYLNQVSASHKKDQSKSIKILEDLIDKLENKDKTHSKDSDGFHGSKGGSASF